jgi:hypothetical protein
MYDTGRLIHIGNAEAVILGIAQMGWDPDGSDFPMEFEFETDAGCNSIER